MASTSLLLNPAPAETPEARALPANVEAEAAFLGALLIDNRILEDMATPLRPEHFFAPVHGRIFERILALVDRKAVVTPVTLKPYFETDDALSELGRHRVSRAADGGWAGVAGAARVGRAGL